MLLVTFGMLFSSTFRSSTQETRAPDRIETRCQTRGKKGCISYWQNKKMTITAMCSAYSQSRGEKAQDNMTSLNTACHIIQHVCTSIDNIPDRSLAKKSRNIDRRTMRSTVMILLQKLLWTGVRSSPLPRKDAMTGRLVDRRPCPLMSLVMPVGFAMIE
jgi:hypothetical protein